MSTFNFSENGAQKGPFVTENASRRGGYGQGSLTFLIGEHAQAGADSLGVPLRLLSP